MCLPLSTKIFGRVYSKRAISALQGRDGQTLSRSQEIALIGALTSAFLALRNGAQSNLAQSITEDFDGRNFGVNSQNFLSVYNFFPEQDPLQSTEGLLCTGTDGGRFISDQQSVTNCACQLPRNLRSSAVNAPPNTPHLSKRTVEWSWDIIASNDPAGTGEPSVGQIIDGITQGHLQYMYTNIIRYTGGQDSPDGIIEMAWQIPAGNAGAPYRSIPGDNYVVLHAHTNHIFVPQEGGPRYPGIYGYVSPTTFVRHEIFTSLTELP